MTRKKAPPISDATRAKMSASAKKRSIKPETLAKMLATRAKRSALNPQLIAQAHELIERANVVIARLSLNRKTRGE